MTVVTSFIYTPHSDLPFSLQYADLSSMSIHHNTLGLIQQSTISLHH